MLLHLDGNVATIGRSLRITEWGGHLLRTTGGLVSPNQDQSSAIKNSNGVKRKEGTLSVSC